MMFDLCFLQFVCLFVFLSILGLILVPILVWSGDLFSWSGISTQADPRIQWR